jgi:hypothetical protein
MLLYVVSGLGAILFSYFKFFRKKEKVVQAGDYVMLKAKYKASYPDVPTMFALKVEKIEEEKAVVIFIHSNNKQVCKEIIPLFALSKAV